MFKVFSFIKGLFSRKEEQLDIEIESFSEERDSRGGSYIERNGLAVETDDPLMAEVVTRAFLSGDVVVGHRDEDGNESIESYPSE